MIISLGYRINSSTATKFRQWATQRLKEYIIKGFVIDDERLKGNGGGNYWKELLAGPGNVSHDQAMKKAKDEYRKYQEITMSPVEEEYLKSIKEVEKEVKKQSRKRKA